MTKKQFEAVLSKNDLAEKIGELFAEGKITSGEADFMNTQLRYMEAAFGENNQPSAADSFERGSSKVLDNKGYYGIGDTIEFSWHIDDVKSIAEDLTDEQARKVLEAFKRNDAQTIYGYEILETIISDMRHDGELPQEKVEATA